MKIPLQSSLKETGGECARAENFKSTPSELLCLSIPGLVLLFMFGPCLYAIDALKTDAPKQGVPTDPKAKKTFAEAVDLGNRKTAAVSPEKVRKWRELKAELR